MPVFEDNSLRALGIAAAITLGVFTLIATVVVAVRRRYRNAASADSDREHVLLDIARRTKLVLILPIAIYLGARTLHLDSDIRVSLADLAQVCGILQVLFWIAGIIDVFIDRYRRRRLETDPSAVTMIRAFRFGVIVTMWVLGVLVALQNVGINVTAFITGLGIGGVAVALALQNVLGDLFASLSIVFDKPFVVGDFIVVGDDAGTVERIGLKTSHVRSLSGEQLVFSNSDLLKNRIHNYQRMSERRVLFRVGVTYDTPAAMLERIPRIVREIIEKTPNTRFDRAHFLEFGDSSYDFEFVFYVLSPDYNTYMDARQTINLAIVRSFAELSIDFAYPTQTLLLGRQKPPDAASR